MGRDRRDMEPYISGLYTLLTKHLMVSTVVQTLANLCELISVLLQ
jgi:hypothetical protein